MNILKSTLLASAAMLGCSLTHGQTTIAGWTFETSVPTTAGPHASEIGTGSAIGFHASASTTYSNPAGNGSGESFSSNNWAIDDYYQFTVSTTGFESISLGFDQTRSSTGPETFGLFYSTDGESFTQFGSSYTVGTTSWSASGEPKSESSFTFNLSGVTALNDLSSVTFRLIAESAPSGAAGTNRIDNVFITGSSVSSPAIPEPSSVALLAGAAVLGCGVMQRRRKTAV